MLVLFVVGAVFLGACGSDRASFEEEPRSSVDNTDRDNANGISSSSTRSGLPCDVDTVLKQRCQTCHGSTPSAGAPMPLVTQEDLQRDYNGKKVFARVSERINSSENPMPPKPGTLTSTELASLNNWIGNGAPSSSATCDSGSAAPSVRPLSCTPDLTLKPDGNFTMPSGSSDIYMCYGASVKLDKKRHITAFAPHVNNPKIVHHILLFKSPVPVPATPFVCSGVGSAVWELVSGWAPGGTNLELPIEAGYPEEEGTTNWVVQVHYNNASGNFAGEVDESGYAMCTTDQLRQYDAGVAAFGTVVFAVPPRTNYAVNCLFPATQDWDGKKVFNSFPHMHGLGAAMSTKLTHTDGKPATMIADHSNFDFNNQGNFPTNAEIKKGDVIQTRCGWKNPSDRVVLFGETTESEMCFHFLGYYPAIKGYPWVTPSLNPVCIPELRGL